MTRTLTGACLCKNITYRIDLPADQPTPQVVICHCKSCKRYTGSGFSSNIVVPLADLHWLTGSPKLYMSPTEKNGLVRRQFCGDCGSPLTSEPRDAEGRFIVVKSGTLDDESRDQCGEVKAEIWYHRKDNWVGDLSKEGIPRIRGSMT